MAGTPLQDRVMDCTDPRARTDSLERAAAVVREGKVVVLPTDTVYGVGADAFDVVAVAMVLAAKHRGREMPPPVLVPGTRTVDGLATDVPMYARILMRQFWPGPLTVVLRAQPSLQWDLGETNGTVALRMPDDEVALSLLGEVGPMAVTSANVSGQPAAATAREALDQLGGAVAVYLDDGRRDGGAPSTILDCTGEEPVVLRVGALAPDDVRAVLGTTPLHDHPPEQSEPGETTGHQELAEQEPADREPADREPADREPADRESGAGAPTAVEPPTEEAAATGSATLVGSVQPSRVPVPPGAVRVVGTSPPPA